MACPFPETTRSVPYETDRAGREPPSAEGHSESMMGGREAVFVKEAANAMGCELRGVGAHRGSLRQQLPLKDLELSFSFLLWIGFGSSVVQAMKLPFIFLKEKYQHLFVCLFNECVEVRGHLWESVLSFHLVGIQLRAAVLVVSTLKN